MQLVLIAQTISSEKFAIGCGPSVDCPHICRYLSFGLDTVTLDRQGNGAKAQLSFDGSDD